MVLDPSIFVPSVDTNLTQYHDLYRRQSPPLQGGAAMYVEDSFAGREVNGPVMLCIHPHGASHRRPSMTAAAAAAVIHL